jgi:glycosyltransferase involved in cell wall biosynthesis
MIGGARVAVVMPARDESRLIASSIRSIPNEVDLLIVVDDGSTDDTGNIAQQAMLKAGRSTDLDSDFARGISVHTYGIVLRSEGIGVGGAISLGSRHLLTLVDSGELPNSNWVVVVMAGDGQMDPSDLPILIEPIISKQADHVKGNRFEHPLGPKGMPLTRRIGTWWLERLTSLASGIRLRDTQCGYTATSLSLLREWDWQNTWQGFGYPNWWLMEAGRSGFRVTERPVRSIYGDEKSAIRIYKFLPVVSWMLWKGVWRRGVEWYLLGKEAGGFRSSQKTRATATLLWFSAWGLLAAAPLLAFSLGIAWGFAAALAPPAFMLLAALDRREASRRTRGVGA